MIVTPAFHDLFWLFEFVAMVNWGYSSAVKEIHLPVMVSLDSLLFYSHGQVRVDTFIFYYIISINPSSLYCL